VRTLRRLKNWSGMGFRQLEKRAAQLGLVLPRSTITAALHRDVLPREDLVVALVLTCGADQEEVDGWVAARRRIAAATPPSAASPAPAAGLDPHPSRTAGGSWHAARFAVLVRLDTPGVETYQDWRITADLDGLDQITLGVTTPHPAAAASVSGSCVPGSCVPGPGLMVEVRYGARLLRHENPLPNRSQFTLILPRPLRAGQSHDCGIIVRLDPGQPMRPHYVLTATRPCQLFTLRVRFPPDRLPRWVRRVCGEPVRTLDIVAPGTQPLAVDEAGEIYTEFDQPTMYLAYGVQWQPADDPAGSQRRTALPETRTRLYLDGGQGADAVVVLATRSLCPPGRRDYRGGDLLLVWGGGRTGLPANSGHHPSDRLRSMSTQPVSRSHSTKITFLSPNEDVVLIPEMCAGCGGGVGRFPGKKSGRAVSYPTHPRAHEDRLESIKGWVPK
jgi:hypothetical protein